MKQLGDEEGGVPEREEGGRRGAGGVAEAEEEVFY